MCVCVCKNSKREGGVRAQQAQERRGTAAAIERDTNSQSATAKGTFSKDLKLSLTVGPVYSLSPLLILHIYI